MIRSHSLPTRTVRAGLDTDRHHGAVVPPITLSSNFRFPAFGQAGEYDYTRSGNPTRDLLANALADLEGAAGCVVTASGMAAVTVLLLALSQSGRSDSMLDGRALMLLYVSAAALGAVFVRTERRAAEPIVPLDLLADRMVNAVAVCGFFVGVAMFGAISFVPLFAQAALGGNATQAGLALTPLVLGWVAMSVVTGRVVLRVGYRPMVIAGLTLVTVGFAELTQIGPRSSLWLLRGDLAVMGMGMGMTMLSLVLAVQHVVDRRQLGVATSFGQFTRAIGGSVGVAIMGAIVAASLSGGEMGPAEMTHALHRAFAAATIVAATALIAAMRIPGGVPAARPRETESLA